MLDPVIVFVFVLAGVLFLGVFGELVFKRTGVPDALWLVLTGILLGPLLKIVDLNGLNVLRSISPFVSPLALIVILFGGATQLRLKDLFSNISSSSLLGVMVFVLSVFVTVLVTQTLSFFGFLDNWFLFNGLVLGSILGGTSSIVVIPSLIHLKNAGKKLKSVLSLESSFSDVLVIVFVISLVNIKLQPSSEALTSIASSLAATFSVGLVVGTIAGIIWVRILSRFKFIQSYLYMLTFAVLLFLYAFVEFLEGSGAISVLAFGIVFGNYKQLFKFIEPEKTYLLDANLDPFQREVSFFVKTFFFVLIGLLFTADFFALLLGFLLAIALLVVRAVVVNYLLKENVYTPEEKKIAVFAFPRGLAAAVMAILPASLGIKGTENLQAIAFSVILFTILVFTLGMIALNYFEKKPNSN